MWNVPKSLKVPVTRLPKPMRCKFEARLAPCPRNHRYNLEVFRHVLQPEACRALDPLQQPRLLLRDGGPRRSVPSDSPVVKRRWVSHRVAEVRPYQQRRMQIITRCTQIPSLRLHSNPYLRTSRLSGSCSRHKAARRWRAGWLRRRALLYRLAKKGRRSSQHLR